MHNSKFLVPIQLLSEEILEAFESVFEPPVQDKECSTKTKHESLGQALYFCDHYGMDCKGIWDANCDGKNIYTCGKIKAASDSGSPSNGCTYVKKGNLYIPTFISYVLIPLSH